MLRRGQDVYIGMLMIMIAGTFLSPQRFFLLSIVYYVVLILKMGLKIVLPNAPGIKLYGVIVMYTAIIGFVMYVTRNVIRDLYYILPTFLWIFIGTGEAFRRPDKNLKKTIFLYGTFVSVKSFVLFIASASFDFNRLRSIFGLNVYDVGFIMPIAVVGIFLYKEIYISCIIDRIILALMFGQVILSLGRIAILQPFIILAILLLMESRGAENKRVLKRIAGLLISMVVIFGVFFYVMPNNIKNPLMEKVVNSFAEVDASQDISSVGQAMNNWRGYEIQSALSQWKSNGIFSKFLGEGLGKGIEIQYVPFNWAGFVEENEIPLLHNGFYTMFIKGGVLGLAALLWMFLGNAMKGFRLSKKKNPYGNILIAISIAAIANTYVVRGPIQQGTFLIWAVLIGWINCKINKSVPIE